MTKKNSLVPRRFLYLLGWSVLLLISVGLGFGWAGAKAPLTADQQEVAAAAKRYLDAETRRDYRAVFESLYPASEYRQINDFEAYRKEAQATTVRIESYEILGISILAENPDKEKLPQVDGFARVEVDVRIRYTDTKQESLVNYAFPFVRSGGKWYKL